MKRVLFALPLMVMASSAVAAGLTVTNHSGLPIDELTVSAAGVASTQTPPTSPAPSSVTR